jgi:predicted RNA binding protein YcfA (HicA-like mRNA interferase family)
MVASQRGSHIKLRRVLPDGTRQNLTIPNHRELDTGTLKAIYRQALRYIADEDLRPNFYSE